MPIVIRDVRAVTNGSGGNPRHEEPPIGQTLRIVVGVEPGVPKGLHQFGGGEQAELMNLTGASSARSVGDLIVEMEPGETSLDFE
jgi:hypothetical protein